MAITTVSSHVVSVNAIQGTLIADNAITAVHIATNAVSGTLIADNAVTATHIAQNTITVTQIADDAIEAAKLADGIITTNHLNKAMISSQTEVTPVAGDFVLLGDTSDSNNLKKAPISGIVSLAATAADDIATGDAAVTIGTSSGNITLDSPADIILDADGADVFFKDAGTTFGQIRNASNNLRIQSSIQDADIVFRGDDGGSTITALTLDMSEAGFATFNSGVKISGDSSINRGNQTSGELLIGGTTDGGFVDFDGSSLQLNTQRDPNTGTFINTSKSHGGITITGNDADSHIKFYTTNANNTAGTERMRIIKDGSVGIGTTAPSGKFHIEGGRGGIISTSSSWGQFRVANSSVSEVGITVLNGATNSEFLSDTDPSSSNKFIMGISPYGSGNDTWGIGHGNLGDSVMHIDGSGNFGFGVNTDNPLTFFEISKSRPDVNAPADYELKLTLNTYGYVGSGYKLGMIQFVGGDTASAQDNFYAGISARAVNGANHSEDGALEFHVESDEDTDTLAVEINGEHNTGSQIAGAGSTRNGMLFQWQGIAIDRSWANYPGIAVMNSSAYSTTASTQAEFRVHGTNGSNTSYPGSSGSDFSVDFRVDGAYQSGSDRRRKKNITTIDNALSTVKQLTGKKFQIINRADEVQENVSKNGYKFGLIAQEVENIIPETVKYNANEDDGTENWNSSYSIDYPSLTALLVNAIKEQDTVIQDLKSRIETLEG